MKYILKKAEVTSESGFVGNGKLTPAEKSKDSCYNKKELSRSLSRRIARRIRYDDQ